MDQLLYGSADGITGRQQGGWGVIQEAPPLSPQRRDQLASLASVYLAQTMPQFPSARDLERRSVRFRLLPAGEEFIVCMSAEAGPDHTGRPGNVISHCAAVPVSDEVRPVDWFFSDAWVLPHGAQRVAEAKLEGELRPSGWAATAEWLRADPQRIVRAKSVVSKGVAVIQSGRPLIAVSSTPQEGARWLSAICWMFLPEVAARYQLRIGEDARSMGEVRGREYLAVLGRDVVIPESLEPGVVDTELDDDTDGEWGQVLADLLMEPPTVAEAIFRHRDELVRRYRKQKLTEPFRMVQALRVAWLAREGAQNFGQEKTIRTLLDTVGPTVRQWPELQVLATSIGDGDDAYGVGENPYGGSEPVESPDEVYAEVDDTYLTEPTIKRPIEDSPVAAGLVDRALAAARRLGDARASETPATGEDPTTLADRLLVAAASSEIPPSPDTLASWIGSVDLADPGIAQAATILVVRSELAHGAKPDWNDARWRRLADAIAGWNSAVWLAPWAARVAADERSVLALPTADGRPLTKILGGEQWQ